MAYTANSEAFYVDMSASDNSAYMIIFNSSLAETIRGQGGSYGVVGARLFGLSYPDYCRMVRDKYNGTLLSKVGKYMGIKFKNKKDAENLCKELKRRWNYAKESGVFGN